MQRSMLSASKKVKTAALQSLKFDQLSLAKTKLVPLRFASQGHTRIRTQEDQTHSSIFSMNFSENKPHSVSLKDSRKEYVMIRQQRLRKHYDQYKDKINKGQSSVGARRKIFYGSQAVAKRGAKKPTFSQITFSINTKDVEKNILHLMRIFDGLLKKKDHKLMIQRIKKYILEEETDLNELELCLEDKNQQLMIKSILFYERVLLIILVQALINKRYRFSQQNILQIFKDYLAFYVFLYESMTDSSFSKILQINDLKIVLPYLPQHSDFNLKDMKEKIEKRISVISKQFGDLDRFVARQMGMIRSQPSNLMYYKLLQFYAGKLTLVNTAGWGIQFLSTCPSPYVNHEPVHKFTLLLDLDQTLVHFRTRESNRGQFLLRPHLFSFLSRLSAHYELGIFTCSIQSYADSIIEHLPGIAIRLYRQHAVKLQDGLVKDLSRVGRDLSRVILVDNLDKNFQLQKNNGIHVRSWFGDPKDNILEELGLELENLAKACPTDLRLSSHRRQFL